MLGHASAAGFVSNPASFSLNTFTQAFLSLPIWFIVVIKACILVHVSEYGYRLWTCMPECADATSEMVQDAPETNGRDRQPCTL